VKGLIDLQTISVVIAAMSVVIGVINSILSSRRAEKTMRTTLETRQAQLFMQLYTKLNERELHSIGGEILNLWEWSDFDEFMEKYGPENNFEDFNKFSMVGTYFNGIGILVSENLVDIRLVTRFGSVVNAFWEKIEPIIEDWRELYNFPRMLSDTEYLYNEMQKYIEKHPELGI
jgi:hypothetical protein